ncbi:spondin domain-containing protein [Kaarinaea lacus]
MTKYPKDKAIRLTLAILMLLLFSACSHDDDDHMMPSMATYEVEVANATNGQPLTPIAVVAHTAGYQPWTLGGSASTGLEMLAEGGDVSQFIADADADANVEATVSSTNGPFGPGATESVMIDAMPASDLQISVAAMLANTNDAFTGLANVSVGELAMGDSLSMMAHVYDAGTEGNSETAATMPGPAAGGEGFNAARDDTDFVSIHAGVVTADDGLTTSALTESHRWLGFAAKITITRVQ